MGNFLEASAAPVVKIINDNEFTFPILKRKQIAELAAKWQEEDRNKLVKSLINADANPETISDAVNHFELTSGYVGWSIKQIWRLERAEEVLRKSVPVIANYELIDDENKIFMAYHVFTGEALKLSQEEPEKKE